MCISNMYISLPLYFDEILLKQLAQKQKSKGCSWIKQHLEAHRPQERAAPLGSCWYSLVFREGKAFTEGT